MPRILYSDDHITVCIKPGGIPSQSPGMPERLAELLLADAPLLPVHRLDRDVSGVMVYARTPEAAASLSTQITAGEMRKEYLAVLCGDPLESGELEDLLYHDPKRNKSYVVDRMRRGVRQASLSYRVLGRAEGYSLVRILLHTGRTHQIRVQFGSRKWPVAGDARYGDRTHTVGGRSSAGNGSPTAGKLALFSCALRFRHPVTGEPFCFDVRPDVTGVWSLFADFLTLSA